MKYTTEELKNMKAEELNRVLLREAVYMISEYGGALLFGAIEEEKMEDGWKYGDELILQPQIFDPPWETKSDYAICAAVAEKLGIGAEYTEGRDEKQWIAALMDEYRESRFPDLPSLEEFEEKNLGVYSRPVDKPNVAFEKFRKNPADNPLQTASGKIEIFSAISMPRDRFSMSSGCLSVIFSLMIEVRCWST